MTKTLVVGCGFVGAYVARDLLMRAGERVTVLDVVKPSIIKSHPLLSDFAKDPLFDCVWASSDDALTSLGNRINDYDNIIYTAAIADVPFATKNPRATAKTNVLDTIGFFELLRYKDYPGKVIMMSSESIYGRQPTEKLPLKEDDTFPQPINLYGASKLAQETYALTYQRSYGIRTTVLRSATLFGPYSRPDQAMNIFIGQALRGEDITLEGDGSATRDFYYITDLVNAINAVLNNSKEDLAGEIFNIGTGEEHTIASVVQSIRTLLRPITSSKVINKPWREGEKGLRVVSDISKAKKVLGYEPQTSLVRGMISTILWYASDLLHWGDKQMEELHRALGIITSSGRQVGDTITTTTAAETKKQE